MHSRIMKGSEDLLAIEMMRIMYSISVVAIQNHLTG